MLLGYGELTGDISPRYLHSLPLAMKYSQNVEIAIGTFEAKENTFLGIARPDVASALGSK